MANEEDKRRARFGEIVSTILEWMLIFIAVVGFGAMILLNAISLFKQYGLAVPVSIIVAVIVVLFANRKRC